MRELLMACVLITTGCVVGEPKPDVPEKQPAELSGSTPSEPHYGPPHRAEPVAAAQPAEAAPEPWRPVSPKVPLEASGAGAIARQAAWVRGKPAAVTTVDKQGNAFAVALKDAQGRELRYTVDATTAEVKESK